MNLDAKALVGFFKEIEASRDRQKAETEHQREIFKQARAKHFDPKAMRIVLQRRVMDAGKRDEQDYNVDCYELALAGKKAAIEALEQGATVREAAEAGGISTGAAGNLAKAVQKSSIVDSPAFNAPKPVTTETGSPPHDPATGEFKETTDATADRGRGDAGVAEDEPVGALPATDEGCANDATYQQHLEEFRRTPDSAFEAAERARAGAVARPSAVERVATPPDDLEIPAFLVRTA